MLHSSRILSHPLRWLVCLALLIVAAPAFAQQPDNWSNARALDLTRQALAHSAQGDRATAIARLLQALTFDPSHGPAWLLLGQLREANNDLLEAMRTYNLALDRVPALVDLLCARAALLERLGRLGDATVDIASARAIASRDPVARKTLIAWFISRRAWSAALQLTRASLAASLTGNDAEETKRLRVAAAALAALSAECDPVQSPAPRRDWHRRSLQAVARRLGAL